MSKITLDRDTFKALASDTRLDILRALDGKKMSLKDISKATTLNKATLHEHLAKLHDAGLVKRKEREGHKWVYYKLTWKGESLLHPENTKIVVLFTTTFIALWAGIVQLIWYIKGTVPIWIGDHLYYSQEKIGSSELNDSINETGRGILSNNATQPQSLFNDGAGGFQTLYQNPLFLYLAIACFVIFTTVLCIALWRLRENKTPKL